MNYLGLLVIAAVLQIVWGLVPSASKFVIDEIPVELYIALRWTISGMIFAIYICLAKTWRPVKLKSSIAVGGLGILGYGLASFCTLYGLKVGGVTNFALMSTLGPAITSSMAILILKEKPSRLFYLALPLSLTGLILLVTGKYQLTSWNVAGLSAALVLGGCFLEALVFVFSKRFKTEMPSTQYLAISQISAALVMWLSQGIAFHQTQHLIDLTGRGFLAAIFVSVVACVLCYATLYWLLNYIDGHKLALFDGFHTLSATFFGYLLFDEVLTPMMITGGSLILVSLIIGNLSKNLFLIPGYLKRSG
jgi:drug/metabolite transporter (DMT)-like permease